MSLNYDEAIAELRQEEKRLLTELEQVQAAVEAEDCPEVRLGAAA